MSYRLGCHKCVDLEGNEWRFCDRLHSLFLHFCSVNECSQSVCVSPLNQMAGIKLNTGAFMPALSMGFGVRDDRIVDAIESSIEVSVYSGL